MKQLPADTVRLLSSSQVITSVVNVLKELLENSLDASASSIDVKLDNFGLDRIEVRDNGHGIKAADTSVMAVRHYTSKISSHDDLEHLETYGFRGEALGSICAVAEVAVTTKTVKDDVSIQYTLNFQGEIVSQKPSHLGQGTTVSVTKIFKNLPVRRQYYSSTRKCKDELKKIQDLLMAYAIIKPELRLTLVHNKVVVWQKSKVADLRSALQAALGPSHVSDLLPSHYHQDQLQISLEGLFPKAGAEVSSTSSSSPDRTFIFVNNRPVHHKDVLKLLRQHYSAQYPDDVAQNRYPTLVLSITVPSSSVDVNLTPDKTQVLLQNKEAVLSALESMLVSLYGSQPAADPPAENSISSSSLPQTSTCSEEAAKSSDITPPVGAGGDTSLVHQTSNSSSSSSVADDWFVNHGQMSETLPSNFDFYEDEMTQICRATTETCSTNASQERPAPEGDHDLLSGNRKVQLSAEDWSRGTALTDPVSGEPLQPVKLLQPMRQNSSGCEEVKHQCSSIKTKTNAITARPDGLTAYDLISNHLVRAPLSSSGKEANTEVHQEGVPASPQDISVTAQQRRKKAQEVDHRKSEETSSNHSDQAIKPVPADVPRTPKSNTTRAQVHSQKRKAPLSNQQLLDELFTARPQKKMRDSAAKPWQPLLCSVADIRLRLQRLSSQSSTEPGGLRPVNPLASQNAWVILCGQRLMLFNPLRVEEALLFKRLLEDNILPAERLQNPIQLTDGLLGGAEFTEALCNMEKQSPDLNGRVLFSDPRLVANGFQIRMTSDVTSAQRHLEVTAMADCVPFISVDDLREILTAVLHRKARTVQECRPLKVTNYLQGEAVRLSRQLPTNLSREDVEDTLVRMKQQLSGTSKTCIHGRSFLQHLCVVPSTEYEVKALLKPLEL